MPDTPSVQRTTPQPNEHDNVPAAEPLAISIRRLDKKETTGLSNSAGS